jgi:hypothetical protein
MARNGSQSAFGKTQYQISDNENQQFNATMRSQASKNAAPSNPSVNTKNSFSFGFR